MQLISVIEAYLHPSRIFLLNQELALLSESYKRMAS